MLLPMIALLAGAAQAGASMPTGDAVLARMAALYDEVCLQTFPIDGDVDALMARKGATPLTPEEVKVTLGNDPGRGWVIKDGDRDIQVYLELPPFHACTVRRMTPQGLTTDVNYRAVVDRYKITHAGFGPGSVMERDIAGLHIHGVTEFRALPGGGGETLMVVDQHVIDPARRAKGETAISLRFVHQFRLPS